MTQDECSLEQYMHKMSEVLRCPYTVQAARPARHWWLCPRGLAWFQVLMVWSLVKPPASGGPLSRIGDYLCAARGPGLFLRIWKRTTFPPKLDFIHLSQIASQLIGNETPCSLQPKGWSCCLCRSPLAVPLASLHRSFRALCGSMSKC